MFGRQVDDGEALDVDLFHDVADDADHDVDFGAARPQPSGRWWLVPVGVLAVAFLVLVMTTFARDGDDAAVTPTTVAPAVSADTPATTDPPRTTAEPSRRTTTSTVSELADSAPLLDTDEPWSIFAFDQNNGRTLRIDVQSGETESLAGSASSFVLAPQGSFPIPSSASGSFGVQGLLPAGPEYGTFWNMEFRQDGPRLELLRVLPGGEVEELRDLPLGYNEYLMGSTATGQAVVYGPDGDAYTIATADDSRQKFSKGRLTGVQNGFYAEVVCDDAGACRQVLHGAVVVEEPYGQELAPSFSPTGTWVALAAQDFSGAGGPVRLLNLVTGSEFVVNHPFTPSFLGFGGPTSLVFTPDERWAVGISASTLVTVDLTTGDVERTPLPPRIGAGQLAVSAVI